MHGYAHPEVLVETDWVKANLGKPGVELVEIDVDSTAHDPHPRRSRLQLADRVAGRGAADPLGAPGRLGGTRG
jgi:hypothetical protein